MKFDYYKYHALGNDYIVIDPNRTNIGMTTENIQLICHRNFGIGSDGILYGPVMDAGAIGLKILNPDGSEAEKSGNGLRIFSRYLVDTKYVNSRDFLVRTLGGDVLVEVLDKDAKNIKVDMGMVTYKSDRIPVNGPSRDVISEPIQIGGKEYHCTCLSIGNPHCVIPLKEISKELAMEIGPLVENHTLFPKRINMQLLKVIDRHHIQIEIWERGAGYTLASGSSSCAAASAAYRLDLAESQVEVRMPGGMIEIDIQPNGHVFMTGSVTSVSKGNFSDELRGMLKSRIQ